MDKQKAQLESKHKAPNSDSSQDRQATTDDNIPLTVRKMQAQAQKQPIQQQTCRKVNVGSNWSDMDDGRDNQARGRPVVVDSTSDYETDMDQQPSTSTPSTSSPLRRPNTLPKALSFGRGRGNFPVTNWTSVAKGRGCRFISKYDAPQAPPVHQEPTVERNLAIVAPTNRVQTYEWNRTPSKSRKDLANWSWVRLGNTRARLAKNNNNNRMENKDSGRDPMTIQMTGL